MCGHAHTAGTLPTLQSGTGTGYVKRDGHQGTAVMGTVGAGNDSHETTKFHS